jgi:hypothetical protein
MKMMMTNIKHLIIVSLLCLVGCVGVSNHTSTRSIPMGDLLFQDDFSSNGTWDTYDTPTLKMFTRDNVFYVESMLSNQVAWSLNRQSQTNSVASIDAYLMNDTPNNYYGLMCRVNNNRGYIFLVSTDGAYSIRQMMVNKLEPLVEWQNSDAVKSGANSSNHLRIVCDTGYLAFYVNNIFLAEVRDAQVMAGSIGLAVGVGEQGHINVLFDNLKVWDTQ